MFVLVYAKRSYFVTIITLEKKLLDSGLFLYFELTNRLTKAIYSIACEKPKTKNPSKLSKEVQDLINLIFDMKMIDKGMKEIGYDAKKMPLGKLAKSSILKGYEALKNLMD